MKRAITSTSSLKRLTASPAEAGSALAPGLCNILSNTFCLSSVA